MKKLKITPAVDMTQFDLKTQDAMISFFADNDMRDTLPVVVGDEKNLFSAFGDLPKKVKARLSETFKKDERVILLRD